MRNKSTCRSGDVINPVAWMKEGPVFSKTEEAFGPGHASFIKSGDEKQDYIVYHVAVQDGSGWDRNIRMQKFAWEGDTPYFGKPIAEGVRLESPTEDYKIHVLSSV